MHGAYAEVHPTIDEFRPAHYINCFDAGLDPAPNAREFAASVAAEVGAGTRVGLERATPSAIQALERCGIAVIDAEPLMERARSIKSAEELVCMRHSIAVAEAAMDAMREVLRPGITENQLWAMLHQVNIANDGDWIDGRMLSSDRGQTRGISRRRTG